MIYRRKFMGTRCLPLAILLVFTLLVGSAFAQVQRSFINLGFEDPLFAYATRCIAQWNESAVPGWTTNHPSQAPGFNTCTPILGTLPGPLIELWHLGGVGFAGGPVTSRAGDTHAELNAEALSRLYQNVCLVAGETVAWRLSHRGRNSFGPPVATAYDVMRLQVDASAVATFSSSPMSTFAPPVIGVFGGSASGTAGPNGWTDYAGSFVYTGPSGVRQIGFESLSSQDGGTQGNFLDEIQITLKPYLEFNSPSSSGLESLASPAAYGLNVLGIVPTSFTVPVTVTGGTAALGTDFTTPSGGATFNVTIPAGNYTSATLIPLGITIINDTFAETNEMITFSIASSTAGSSYVTASTTLCGSAAKLTTTYTILDDDRPTISINKTRMGGTGTVNFGFSGTNGVPTTVTNIPTTADNTSTTVPALTNIPLTTDGVAVTIIETQPSAPWRLTAASCIDANAGNAQLGNTNPATNVATFSGNAVTIPAANVLHTSQFNCNLTNTRFADITLAKIWVEAAPNNAVTVAATGLTSLLSVANTANETDTGAIQTVGVGSVLTLSELFTAGSATNYASTLDCTGTSGLAGSTLTVGNADTAIVCTYTNRSILIALTITKTDSKSVTTSGGTNNYIVTVSNAGPASANGTVLTDVVGSGLTCPAANPLTCTVIASGVAPGASCPSPITVGNLTGTGVTIATLPANGTLQFAYTCNVN